MKYFSADIDLNEVIIVNQEFDYLFEVNTDYYQEQINKINSDFINDLAKALISQYRLKYYSTFNNLIKNNDVDREEYDFYNMKFFDVFLENTKNNIRVFNEKDLKILNSIINISNIFLKNAIDQNDFESLLNSFYKLKDKLESNKFILNDNRSITVDYIEENNLFGEKILSLNLR
ncbi:hypothetical protein [Methanobrevibacter sp.]|uniref:hypothetical protein n=1 Tax=Methanobrevibacter sp. TaxID=66852 RepID=UPI00388FC4C6